MPGNRKRANVPLLILLLLLPSFAAGADELPSAYHQEWQEDLGLWGTNPQIRTQAWMLAAAALDGVLDKIDTTRVLRNLRIAQEKHGPYRGCFWWQWSDQKITDTNSGFFTTFGLLALLHTGYDQLNREQRELLHELLSEARYWFERETRDLERHLRYPNKCLGDVVCMWLLAEHFGTPTPEQEQILDKTLAYYRESNWGWGEHMSDIYVRVLQDELVALYMWGRSLSPRQKQEVWQLFLELVAIDDIFDGGPRVPAIRSYSATRPPAGVHYTPYRDLVVPWDRNSRRGSHQPVRAVAYASNIRALLPEKAQPPRHIEIPCYGGARALATRTNEWRLGAMTWYPIMEDIDHRSWGLSWQSMPVAYWRAEGDWAFLQWESVVDGSPRTHPQPYSSSFGDAPKSLADSEPGMVGRTYAVRRGDGFVVLRRCARSPGWSSFKDRFRLINTTAEPTTRTHREWNILDLHWDSGDNLQIQFLPLVGHGKLVLVKNPYDGYDWEYSYDLEGEEFAALWILLPYGKAPPLPSVEKTAAGVGLRWSEGQPCHLEIDLLATTASEVLKVSSSEQGKLQKSAR